VVLACDATGDGVHGAVELSFEAYEVFVGWVGW